MRRDRQNRPRAMSDAELEHALIGELVEWLTSPGVLVPPRRLQSLYGAYRGRFLTHGDHCTCWQCLEVERDALEVDLELEEDWQLGSRLPTLDQLPTSG